MTWNELKKKIEALTPVERRRTVKALEPYTTGIPPLVFGILWTANAQAVKSQRHCRLGHLYLAK